MSIEFDQIEGCLVFGIEVVDFSFRFRFCCINSGILNIRIINGKMRGI